MRCGIEMLLSEEIVDGNWTSVEVVDTSLGDISTTLVYISPREYKV